VPEGYAIEKDGRMYYAFYAPGKGKTWSGEIELRGLGPSHYQVVDYENGKSLGDVSSQNPKLRVSLTDHLLLEASPH
jgi:alpha-galactosidase